MNNKPWNIRTNSETRLRLSADSTWPLRRADGTTWAESEARQQEKQKEDSQ